MSAPVRQTGNVPIQDVLTQDILSPLAAWGERSSNVGCAASLVCAPIPYLALYYIFDMGWVGVGVGGTLIAFVQFMLWFTVSGILDPGRVEKARKEFNRRFPLGTSQRDAALRFLATYQSDQEIIKKLKTALNVTDEAPGPQESADERIESFLEGLEAPPPEPFPQASPPPAVEPTGGERRVRENPEPEGTPEEKRIQLDFEEVQWEEPETAGTIPLEIDSQKRKKTIKRKKLRTSKKGG